MPISLVSPLPSLSPPPPLTRAADKSGVSAFAAAVCVGTVARGAAHRRRRQPFPRRRPRALVSGRQWERRGEGEYLEWRRCDPRYPGRQRQECLQQRPERHQLQKRCADLPALSPNHHRQPCRQPRGKPRRGGGHGEHSSGARAAHSNQQPCTSPSLLTHGSPPSPNPPCSASSKPGLTRPPHPHPSHP